MKEIEIKAKLIDKAGVMARLAELGCEFDEPMVQKDIIYVKNIGTLETYKSNDTVLRIRVRNDEKIIFTTKKRGVNDLDALEYETEVESKDEIEQSVLMMGYKEAVRVNKVRITALYKKWEICIDDVQDLGAFIEMEQLTETGDSVKIQDEMFNFFITLGIKEEDRVYSGYDILMLEHNTK